MQRLYYGYSKTAPYKGYVLALKCDDKFYVISKQAYENIRKRLNYHKPVFYTDLHVFVDGINI